MSASQQSSQVAQNDKMIRLAGRFFFKTKDQLARGSTCRVYKATEKDTGKKFVIKRYNTEFKKVCSELINREISALKTLKHRHIVEFVEHLVSDRDTHVIVMEFCNRGSLYDQIELRNGLDDDWMLAVIKCLSESYKILWKKEFIHRDIKPGNLLVHIDEAGQLIVKLGDLGSAIQIDQEVMQFRTLCGTAEYLHPDMQSELVRRMQVKSGQQNPQRRKAQQTILHTAKCDLWSIAVTVYHAACNQLPFVPNVPSRETQVGWELMNAMYQKRAAHHISGQHIGYDTKNNNEMKIQWSSHLTAQCRVSASLRPFLERTIMQLMQSDEQLAWDYPDFFWAADSLVRLHRVPVFNVATNQFELIYVERCRRKQRGGREEKEGEEGETDRTDDDDDDMEGLTANSLIKAIKRRWKIADEDDEFFLVHPIHGIVHRPSKWRDVISQCDWQALRGRRRIYTPTLYQYNLRLSDHVSDTFFLVQNCAKASFLARASHASEKDLQAFEKLIGQIDERSKECYYFDALLADSSNLLKILYKLVNQYSTLFSQQTGQRNALDLFFQCVLLSDGFTGRSRLVDILLSMIGTGASDEKDDGDNLLFKIRAELDKFKSNAIKAEKSLANLHAQRNRIDWSDRLNRMVRFEASVRHVTLQAERSYEEMKLLVTGQLYEEDVFHMEVWPRMQNLKSFCLELERILAEMISKENEMIVEIQNLFVNGYDWLEKHALDFSSEKIDSLIKRDWIRLLENVKNMKSENLQNPELILSHLNCCINLIKKTM